MVRWIVGLLLTGLGCVAARGAERPNIVFIMADDQGYADAGCYGSVEIRTPHIDRLAAEGVRFTDAYSGSCVCAPTRCVLMTGLHPGHARRRDNAAKAGGLKLVPLLPEDRTVAAVLKQAGYVTGGFGKWGLGNPGTTGVPELHGFDLFFGYYDQVHAHDYYPTYLVRNSEEVPLPGNKNGKREQYSHDVLAEAALDFVREHRDQPFFLYLPFTPPHGKYEVPSDAPYTDKPWSQTEKNYAAMITRMDEDVGDLMALIKALGLDEKTLVFYTSDNGPNPPFLKTFKSNAPFRGIKRDLLEGGVRCPMIVRWPGKIAPGSNSDFVWGHLDILATLADLVGVEAPKNDGLSVLPTLLGKKQAAREYMYWEFYSGFQQSVRMGNWKGLRYGTKAPLVLYDLAADPAEKNDLAMQHPDVVKRIEGIMLREHIDSPHWPVVTGENAAKRKKGKADQ